MPVFLNEWLNTTNRLGSTQENNCRHFYATSTKAMIISSNVFHLCRSKCHPPSPQATPLQSVTDKTILASCWIKEPPWYLRLEETLGSVRDQLFSLKVEKCGKHLLRRFKSLTPQIFPKPSNFLSDDLMMEAKICLGVYWSCHVL